MQSVLFLANLRQLFERLDCRDFTPPKTWVGMPSKNSGERPLARVSAGEVGTSAKVTITYPHFCYTHQYWQNLFNLTEAFYLPLDFLHLP